MKNENEVTALVATLEKCREIVGCPEGVDLQDHLRQLAAENVELKAGRKFFMYSDDSGFETFKTQREAVKAAQEMIDVCREDAYDGWPEEADSIRWGVVMQQATEADFQKPAPENGWVGSSDYKLLPETPATDRTYARAKADGAEACVRALVTSDDDDFSDAPNICAEVARWLREGAK